MKKIAVIGSLILFVLEALCPAAAAPVKFEGTWVLNRAKSQGLTGGLANAEVILIVTQDEKTITADHKIKIRGREQPSQPLTYNLDGTETTAEVVRPLAGTMYLKARVLQAGRGLELRSTITGNNQENNVTIITKEYWELAGGGKALRITRVRTTPDTSVQFKLYFEKQS